MSVERELTNGTPPTLSLTIVDSGRDAMLIWLELGTRTILPRARRGGGQAAAPLEGRAAVLRVIYTPAPPGTQTVHVHALNKRGPNTAISNIVLNVLFASSAFSQ